jgi:hypothetical protein
MRRVAIVLGLLVFTFGCRNVEVEKALQLDDVSTGWYDAGIMEDGKNKLVPSITLKLKNVTGEPVSGVQIWGIFKRVAEAENWGDHFVRGIGQEGLAPGARTSDIVLRSTLGYTGDQPRQQMLQNAQFVDARVEVFGKQGSRTWVKMGEYPIERKLLAH